MRGPFRDTNIFLALIPIPPSRTLSTTHVQDTILGVIM